MNALLDIETLPGGRKINVVRAVSEEDAPRKKGAVDAWLDHLLRRYFGQKRAMWQGSDRSGHEFGWSSASVMGKLRDERGGVSARDIHYAEFYTPDVLLVRRAIEGVDYDPYVVGHVHYMVPASVKVKSREAGYAPSSYYDYLTVFHTWTEGRIELLDADVSRQKIPTDSAAK